ncbi:Glutathione peroxidase [Fusarium falciforme]|uniref:Glutathione peroxidase n=1 Tax=Fusarium falciforme TaxID=195108 RepID=UPI0023012710|nr:Glutathione peroxidase [Fusarium falciforme]WAO94032.1 Glutathione peroxidase [Fusarium falciforme]
MPWRVPESLPLLSRRCMRGLNKPTIRTSICSPPLSPLNNNIKRAAFFRLGYRKFPSVAAFSTSIPRSLPSSNMASATSFYDFKPLDKRGQEVPLADYKGKVVLIVNTASKCGFTPQYAGLEKLWTDIKQKHPDDFVILGFPCNQFGAQEPGSDEEIQSFCQVNYGVTFPIMQKTEVNGDGTNPLWAWLKEQQPGLLGLKRVKWNFEKFLVGRDGKVKGRWASTTKPESLEKPILDALAEEVKA